MKTVTVRDLQKRLKQCVDDAQQDRVVITRHGKPAAVLVGVEGADWDTVVLQSINVGATGSATPSTPPCATRGSLARGFPSPSLLAPV